MLIRACTLNRSNTVSDYYFTMKTCSYLCALASTAPGPNNSQLVGLPVTYTR